MTQSTKLVRHIFGGLKARASMERLLGLGDPGKEGMGWRLEHFEGIAAERVHLVLRGGDSRLTVYLGPASDPEAFIKTSGLSICYEGDNAGDVLDRHLKLFASRLDGLTLEDVFRILEEDPQSIRQTKTDLQATARVPYVFGPVRGHNYGWRNFFADKDFLLSLHNPSWTASRSVFVTYADRECFFARPTFDPRKLTFLDYPFETIPPASAPFIAECMVVAELSEKEIILGTGKKVTALLEEVRRKASDDKMVFVNHLCMPVVMGDDLEALARMCREATGRPVLSFTRDSWDALENFGDLLTLACGEVSGLFDAPADPLAVNLFDFPTSYRNEELVPMLQEMGLKVNVCLFPEWDIPSLRRLPNASLQIFCGRAPTETKLRRSLTQVPRRTITVPPPYGIEGTRECLRRIAVATGKEEAFETVWRRRWEALRRTWEGMVDQARRYRLGFVCCQATLPLLTRPRLGQGPVLLKVVQEMGFGTDILLYRGSGSRAAVSSASGPIRAKVFADAAELKGHLREGAFRAVYSDIFFDWRLTKAGKAQFSCRNFEMGMAGAARSLKELLALCRLPFYERYADSLGRVPGRGGRA